MMTSLAGRRRRDHNWYGGRRLEFAGERAAELTAAEA